MARRRVRRICATPLGECVGIREGGKIGLYGEATLADRLLEGSPRKGQHSGAGNGAKQYGADDAVMALSDGLHIKEDGAFPL